MTSPLFLMLGLLFLLGACGPDSHSHEADGGPPDAGGFDATTTDGPPGCPSSGVEESGATRDHNGSSVTVKVTLLNALQHCAKPELAFKLVLDTHSFDLLSIDIVASSRIETSDGTTVTSGIAWSPGSESSHHRDGILHAPAPGLAGASWLRLTIRDVAGIDRAFEWGADLLQHDLP